MEDMDFMSFLAEMEAAFDEAVVGSSFFKASILSSSASSFLIANGSFESSSHLLISGISGF